jgi:hypothetical protein
VLWGSVGKIGISGALNRIRLARIERTPNAFPVKLQSCTESAENNMQADFVDWVPFMDF